MEFKLRPYQRELLQKTKHLKAYANTFSTGAGKTFTTIQSWNANPTNNLLVICPNNTVKQWEVELKRHSKKDIKLFEIGKSWTIKRINKELKEQQGKYNTIILNFEKILRMTNLLEVLNKDWTIIVDEVHRINKWGNPTRKQKSNFNKKRHEQIDINTTRSVVKLGELAEYKYALSATPVEGKYGGYIEYFPILKFLGYMNLTYDEFFDKYVRWEAINFGTSPYPVKVITGYRHTHHLQAVLPRIFYGYQAKYGDYEPVEHFITVPKSKNYDTLIKENAYKDIAVQNLSQKRVLAMYLTGGVIKGTDLFGVEHEYVDNTHKVDWLKDFLIDRDGKVVIFYKHNTELQQIVKLVEKLKIKYQVVNGKTKDKYETINVKEWDVLIGQYSAIATGTDGLQHKSNHLVLYSLPESSNLYIQALGRIDREGQTKVPNYYFLEMQGTIDTHIRRMIENKLEFLEADLDRYLLEVSEGENENE